MKRIVASLCGVALGAVAADDAAGGSFRGVDVAETLFCDTQDISSTLSATDARYAARGLCKLMRQQQNRPAGSSTFDDFNNATEVYRFTWTSWGIYNPTTKATVEEIVAPPPRLDEPSPANRPYGRYRIEMICDRDPWLDDTSARCTQPRTTATGNLPPEVQKALAFTGRPFTAYMKLAQREALRVAQRQFDERQATLARIGNQPVTSAAATTTRAGVTASTTTSAAGALRSPSTPVPTSSVAGPLRSPSTTTSTAGTLRSPSTSTTSVAGALGGVAGAGTTAAAPKPTTPPPATATPPATPTTPPPATTAPPASAQPATPPVAAPQPASAVPAPGSSQANAPAGMAPASQRLSGTPGIKVPAPNSEVHQGQLRVQAVVVPTNGARDAEIEFKWLAPNARSTVSAANAPAPVRWSVPIDQLAQGIAVPVAAGPRTSGRWQMSVRGAGSNAWSEPVVFDYVAMAEGRGRGWRGGSNAAERQGLNPQPLPPKEADKASPLERSALNPQPLPPKEAKKANPFERSALNPQPLPPKDSKVSSPLERQGLNPQPLPPRDLSAPASAFQR